MTKAEQARLLGNAGRALRALGLLVEPPPLRYEAWQVAAVAPFTEACGRNNMAVRHRLRTSRAGKQNVKAERDA